MKVGDFFQTKGYQEMARMEFSYGDVLVLGNNQNYFLVARRTDESMSDGEGDIVELLAEFQYGDLWAEVYGNALKFAAEWVAKETLRVELTDIAETAERKAGWDPNP